MTLNQAHTRTFVTVPVAVFVLKCTGSPILQGNGLVKVCVFASVPEKESLVTITLLTPLVLLRMSILALPLLAAAWKVKANNSQSTGIGIWLFDLPPLPKDHSKPEFSRGELSSAHMGNIV